METEKNPPKSQPGRNNDVLAAENIENRIHGEKVANVTDIFDEAKMWFKLVTWV